MTDPAPERVRLDKWLWHARFARTRSLAATLCVEGHMRIDGNPVAKPGYLVRAGQVLTFALGRHVRVIEIVSPGVRRGPASEARLLYRDLSPPSADSALPRDLPF